MELQQLFDQVMNESINLALATSVDDQPNVRVVTFGFDAAQEDKLYFCTFKGNQKTREFKTNNHIACMPLPRGPQADAQVRIFGVVQKSTMSMDELCKLIDRKMPEDAKTIMEGGDMMEVYEVCFSEAWITVGINAAQKYKVQK